MVDVYSYCLQHLWTCLYMNYPLVVISLQLPESCSPSSCCVHCHIHLVVLCAGFRLVAAVCNFHFLFEVFFFFESRGGRRQTAPTTSDWENVNTAAQLCTQVHFKKTFLNSFL